MRPGLSDRGRTQARKWLMHLEPFMTQPAYRQTNHHIVLHNFLLIVDESSRLLANPIAAVITSAGLAAFVEHAKSWISDLRVLR